MTSRGLIESNFDRNVLVLAISDQYVWYYIIVYFPIFENTSTIVVYLLNLVLLLFTKKVNSNE